MSIDTRQIQRDSLFLMATVRLEGDDELHPVKIRNLSAGGLMAEGPVKVVRGTLLKIDLRNIGEVEGSVAWIQDNRFGVALADEIDPKAVRAGPGNSESPATGHIGPRDGNDPARSQGRLRKI